MIDVSKLAAELDSPEFVAFMKEAGEAILPHAGRREEFGRMPDSASLYYRVVPVVGDVDMRNEVEQFCRDVDTALRVTSFALAQGRTGAGCTIVHMSGLPHIIRDAAQGPVPPITDQSGKGEPGVRYEVRLRAFFAVESP